LRQEDCVPGSLYTEKRVGVHDKKQQRLARLQQAIEHAAHFLPAQGPITAFVHHNTLHAFEHLPFEDAVVKGGELLGCHPFLPEHRYRDKLMRGRIRREDIEAVLIDDLGERGDELLGFLGTRFHLRMAMLAHRWRTGPAAELRWIVAESNALRRFRDETPLAARDHIVEASRRWVMRDLRNGGAWPAEKRPLKARVERLFERFDMRRVEYWSSGTWEAFCLHLLWLVCRDGVDTIGAAGRERPLPVRHRDVLLEATGDDSDQLVQDILIRFCSAFLDQGLASWALPRREGFYRSFLALYGRAGGPPDGWLRGLRREAARLESASITPLESVADSLAQLGIWDNQQETFLAETLLALRGYAGMIWQLENRGDRAARPAPQGSLVEFLAVRLILERLALAWVAKRSLGYRGRLSDLRSMALRGLHRRGAATKEAAGGRSAPTRADERAFMVFQLAQLLGWDAETLYRLSAEGWRWLVSEIEDFSALQRRRIFHLALERRYRIQALDAVAIHSRRVSPFENSAAARRPAFQLACCIDEREESLRRHVEEVAPDCETLGGVGFFAVAMYYRGAADAHYTPLCPVIIQPQHYVVEKIVDEYAQEARRRRRRRRTIGTVTHQVHVGSRTFAGGWLAAVLGSLASIPLVTRILFPRATAQVRRMLGGFVQSPAMTELQLERTSATPGSEGGHIGFSVEEMAAVVERFLRDIGLTKNFSRLVIVCGHGSSSLNNPHEAAHDCGACAGGRGGPNARAFARMANDPRVRRLVAGNGLSVPDDTVFVGAYHNTCDDGMTYYDVDRLPATHGADFKRASASLDEARKRNAHERCRRFETAELNLTFEEALRHVEGRAEDLSQVRPEYGHATNALCFVGRRTWSRGLFLDRRAFLQSYDPQQDDERHTILARILQAVVPVCAGINLEYYFSYVDPTGYGCGTKLPHNITSLLGVMNGAASDLRPGLPWQMVEIHEPVRLLFVLETTPQAMLDIMDRNEPIARLVRGGWVQLATLDPQRAEIHLFRNGVFQRHTVEANELAEVESSVAWYRGWREHLSFASVSRLPIEHGCL
jgi:uncharacterized protein YbcC (UPF0753/DUF2309 family)